MSHKGSGCRLALLTSVGAAALLGAGAANAQEATAAGEGAADQREIVVTAQKRAENVQDVPISISVIDEELLENTRATQLSDIGAYVPGFQVDGGGTPGQTIISLRGVAPVGPGQTVGIYLDETPVGSSSFYARGAEFSLDLLPYDIDRIELLRGPQGTLYGASSIGGLLKYVTRAPDLGRFHVRGGADLFDVSDSNGFGYAGRLAVNVPIIAGKLALSASGAYQHTPGFVDNPQLGIEDQDDYTQKGGRLALRWEPTNTVSVNLGAVWQSIRSEGNGIISINDDATYSRFADGRSRSTALREPFDKDFAYYSASVNWDLGFANFVSATSYSETETRQVQDATSTYGVLFPLFGHPAGLSGFELNLDLKKWTQEFRLSSSSGNRFEWLLGLFYTHEKSANDQYATALDLDGNPIAGLDPLATVGLPTRYKEYAAFANVTYKFSDRFDLSGGLRWARNDQRFRQITFGPLFEFLGSVADDPGASSEDVVTYSVSPRFFVSDDTMIYGRVASGYRPGGPNLLIPGSLPQVDSDSLVNYEVGLKTEFLDRRALVNLALFYMDWKDIQLTQESPDVQGVTFLANAGEARSQGAEVTVVLKPAPGLRLGATGAYVDAQLTEDAPLGQGFKGDRLPRIPKWSGSLTADYDFPIRDGWNGHVGGGLRFVGKRFSALENSLVTDVVVADSYTALDLNADLSNETLTIRLFAKNVTDSKGLQTFTASTPLHYASPIRPRTIGVAVDVAF